ncbi:HTH-type transcriptional regulator MhqR [Sporomusa silvacetica DSM 10669]|uniref:HTH-type transcriptional regulator MhqR n=1 Tax=Sporomusa silvacetica DSM 10669 TaxID=1123289 RepID=A0ABZ3IN80_9FIRM|nr:HTH-type transcriptional regulator MhqR [Sporomusa silvacetica DSM 10669]
MHFARYSLSKAKFNALIQLFMTGGQGLTQSELGKKLLVSRANVTRLIDRLEKEDMVIRKGDPADKRVFQLYLTDRASMLMNTFVPIHNQYVHKIMSVLDTNEKELLITLLDKLKKGLDQCDF